VLNPDDLEFEEPAPPPASARRTGQKPAIQPKAAPARRAPPPVPVPQVRELPHSDEAEQQLISCCLIDEGITLDGCMADGIDGAAFYTEANRTIYETLVSLRRAKQPIDIAVLHEELSKTKRLVGIGGAAYLMTVSKAESTTASAGYYRDRVRELRIRREAIRTAAAITEAANAANNGEPLEDFIARVEASVSGLVKRGRRQVTWTHRGFSSFRVPPEDDPSILLGRYRYICRDGIAIIVGPSHVGKTSLCFQWATCAALGRDFLGIPTHGHLTSLVVNGEDDDGDIGEVREGVFTGLGLTTSEAEQVEKRVIMCSVRAETGDAFFRELGRKAAEVGADLVWINPLLSFAGMDITKPGEASKLRAALKAGNPDQRFAYMLIHHTNKPPSAKDKGEKNWNEFMYDMTGAADLTNMSRAVVTVGAKKTNGEFILRLAKRGKRAGVMRELPADPDEGRGAGRVEIVTEIHARHSTRRIKFESGRELPMIFWEPSEATDDEDGEDRPSKAGGRRSEHSLDVFRPTLRSVAQGYDNRKGINALHRACSSIQSIGSAAFNRLLNAAAESGDIIRTPDGYYMP
jgi:hypothetical protein